MIELFLLNSHSKRRVWIVTEHKQNKTHTDNKKIQPIERVREVYVYLDTTINDNKTAHKKPQTELSRPAAHLQDEEAFLLPTSKP